MAAPIDHAWALLKAIPQSIGPTDSTRHEAHFRESLPDFPLGRHMETVTRPDYRRVAGFGEPAAVLGGKRNMRTEPISSHDSNITRESAYERSPRRNPDLPDDAPYNDRLANYQFGIPRTHRPMRGSTQQLIDRLHAPKDDAERLVAQAAKDVKGHEVTHPTQDKLDEMGMSAEEYAQWMQDFPIRTTRELGLDNNLPGGRLGWIARHGYDMSVPEGQDSIFDI
jgi:hypothetical protein